MLRRLLFGIFWFWALNVAFSFVAAAPYIYEIFTFAPANAQQLSVAEKQQLGVELEALAEHSKAELRQRDNGLVGFASFLIALIGTVLGLLPGTGRRRERYEGSESEIIVRPRQLAPTAEVRPDVLGEATPFAG